MKVVQFESIDGFNLIGLHFEHQLNIYPNDDEDEETFYNHMIIEERQANYYEFSLNYANGFPIIG